MGSGAAVQQAAAGRAHSSGRCVAVSCVVVVGSERSCSCFLLSFMDMVVLLPVEYCVSCSWQSAAAGKSLSPSLCVRFGTGLLHLEHMAVKAGGNAINPCQCSTGERVPCGVRHSCRAGRRH